MNRIRVLSPVGVVLKETVNIPPLPRDWTGRTVGFLDNTKPNFDRLVAGIADVLRERYGVREVVHRKKANAATPAAPEIVAALAKECDVVFTGSGD
jgi:hypothetical protein